MEEDHSQSYTVVRKCSDCKKFKAIFSYRKNSSRRDGLSSRCKECDNLKCKKRVAEIKNLVLEYLRVHGCVDCGEKDPVVLEFDHVYGEKDMAISKMIHHVKSINRIKNEISKCVVRCANCHRKKTALDFKYYRLEKEKQNAKQ